MHFIAIFASVRKDKEKKMKKKKQRKNESLAACFSEMAGAISFKFGLWTPLAGRQLCNKFGSNRIRYHQDTKV